MLCNEIRLCLPQILGPLCLSNPLRVPCPLSLYVMMASELVMEKFYSLLAYFGDDDFIRTSFFFKDILRRLFLLPFNSSSPTLEKNTQQKHQEETINWRVLLLEPSPGRDTSPLSIQLLKAAAGSVMNSVVCRLGLAGRGFNGRLESKPLSEGVHEWVIRSRGWGQAAERDV